jgi:hypothetical protein
MEPSNPPSPDSPPEDQNIPNTNLPQQNIQSDSPPLTQSTLPSSGEFPTPAPSTPQTLTPTPLPSTQSPTMPWDKPSQGPVVMPAFGNQVVQSSGQPSDKKKKLTLSILGVMAGLVLLGGGVAAAYFGIVVPNKPENILKQSMLNALEENTWRSKGVIEFSGSDTLAGKVDYEVQADLQKKAFGGTFDITVSGVGLPVEGRYVDGNAYFKVGDLKTVSSLIGGFASGFGIDQAQVDQLLSTVSEKIANQWVVVDSTLLEESGIKCFQDINLTLNERDKKLLQDRYQKHQFITIKNYTDDKVGDTDAIKYDLRIDNKKLESFANSLRDLTIVKSIEKCAEESDSDLGTDTEVTKDAFPESGSFTVWVDKGERRIIKSSYTTTESGATVKLVDTITNQRISVSAPENAKPVMQLVGELQQSFSAIFPDPSTDFPQIEESEESFPLEFDPYMMQ